MTSKGEVAVRHIIVWSSGVRREGPDELSIQQ